MALQGPFFGKRDEPTSPRSPVGSSLGSAGASTLSSAGAAASSLSGTVAPAASTTPAAAAAATTESTARLTVGPNIKLKGVEITDCDTVVVEGTVEATMHSRVIEIAESGIFKGDAEIDIAEVRGQFDGNLTARQKLVIFATGKVTGKIRYGKIVVEEGGELSGEITSNTSPASAASGTSAAPAGAKSAKGEQLAVA